MLDWDVHHGNGTQGMFYTRGDVLTVSLHADPERFYPFFWGAAQERGEGAGLGYNLNLPLARGTDDAGYQAALGVALQRIRSFGADVVVVALGLDAHEADPLAGLRWTTDDFAWLTRQICDLADECCAGRVVSSLEGGYDLDALAASVAAYVGALAALSD